jgi:hypothetical protein
MRRAVLGSSKLNSDTLISSASLELDTGIATHGYRAANFVVRPA